VSKKEDKELAKAKVEFEKTADDRKKTDAEKVQDGEKDPGKPEQVQAGENRFKEDAKKAPMQRPTGGVGQSDYTPANESRNDPDEAATEPPISPAQERLDRDQSLGQLRREPDVFHAEPSSYTPSGARPGQQNPVNPQGSPGADPHAESVGARPDQTFMTTEQPRDGDYTKYMTEGEKNPSQLPIEIDHQPMMPSAGATPWMHSHEPRAPEVMEAEERLARAKHAEWERQRNDARTVLEEQEERDHETAREEGFNSGHVAAPREEPRTEGERDEKREHDAKYPDRSGAEERK
jgi:hypothetical protein